MTINDIEQMPVEKRARALVGDMPWITECMSLAQVGDFICQITVAMQAAVLQERAACLGVASCRGITLQAVKNGIKARGGL